MNLIENLKSVNLKIDIEILNLLKNAVRNDFEKIMDVMNILEDFPFLKNDIVNRLNNNNLFQPGRIVETMVTQSISNHLNCTYIGGGIYENDYYIITQDGGSGKNDLIINKKENKKTKIFEIKEPAAYGKSCGFTYDDSGTPVDFTSRNKEYREYVESLFKPGALLYNYNILESQGHNKIFDIDDIITNNLDYIISFDKKNGNLSIMTIDEYKKEIFFKIEVRSCGRNTRKVFTKDKLDLVGDILILEKNDINKIIQRGGNISSRYKYIKNNATFSFKKKDLREDDGKFYIDLNKIKQHVGEVAIQHFKKS